MTEARRKSVLIALLLLFLTVAAVWSVGWMTEQREAALYAAAELEQCNKLAADIERLRAETAVPQTEEAGVKVLGVRVTEAAQKAGLHGQDWLEGIYPESARPLPDSPYKRKPTMLSLRGVSLEQLSTFLYHLTDGSGLSVYDLQLMAPRGDSVGDLWNVETTVTYLIYSPSAREGP
jgi:hypothetical protein